MPNFKFGDLKYYYQIHCARQKSLGNRPVSYAQFTQRLKKLNLHDAIYYPRAEHQVRDMKKIREATIQDDIRRMATLNNENIQILDFKYTEMAERKNFQKKMARIQMPKPKKTLLQKIISWIKKK